MKTPNVIESLNFEEILSRMKEELVRRDTNFTALIESDPAMKILEIAAWRELLLRQRINEAAEANLLAFATNTDLDHLAEFYGVERKSEEDDEHLRKKIKAKIAGWSTAGSKEHYRYHALSTDTRVKDALVESLIPGSVQISILSTGGVPSEELLNIVREQVNKDNVKVLTDTVIVVACNIIAIDIHARVSINPAALPDIMESIKKQFIQKFESTLGRNITRSWIIANLFTQGVENVELIEPEKDVIVKGNESTVLGSFKIEGYSF